MYQFAQSFLEKEQIDYFIFGHRHQMAHEDIGSNSKFILLGDWIRNFSYGVFDGEKFELKKIDFEGYSR
jgi:UDP-2,3-diacylglucosamine hydrolase